MSRADAPFVADNGTRYGPSAPSDAELDALIAELLPIGTNAAAWPILGASILADIAKRSAAALAALRAERDSQKRISAEYYDDRKRLAAELRQQESELIAAEKDAKRYRWLRERGNLAYPTGEHLDAAIDAQGKEKS